MFKKSKKFVCLAQLEPKIKFQLERHDSNIVDILLKFASPSGTLIRLQRASLFR